MNQQQINPYLFALKSCEASSFSPLMFITPQVSADEVVALTEAFIRGGGRWVQLRLKDITRDVRIDAGRRLFDVCRTHGAVCIINDSAEVALELGAHGVHLGKSDMPVPQARLMLGDDSIIGGTANTLDDMIRLADEGVDYIGLGPFRFTTTKKNLSPVLGLEGYTRLMAEFRQRGYTLPVTAIGGIVANDIPELMHTGISGVAVSGVIAGHSQPDIMTEQMLKLISSGGEK